MQTPNLPAIRACRLAWNIGRIVGQIYARLMRDWVKSIWLEPSAYGTYSMRRPGGIDWTVVRARRLGR